MSLLEQHDFDFMFPREKRIERTKQYIQDLTEGLAKAPNEATQRLIKNELDYQKKHLEEVEKVPLVSFTSLTGKEL